MAKNEEVLNFIKDWTATHQYPPRLEDIQEAFGFNTRGGAKWHVDQLVKAGLLDRQSKIARGIVANPPHYRVWGIKLKNRRVFLEEFADDPLAPYRFIFARLLYPGEPKDTPNATVFYRRNIKYTVLGLTKDAFIAVGELVKRALKNDSSSVQDAIPGLLDVLSNR
jgi:hypothetical protein